MTLPGGFTESPGTIMGKERFMTPLVLRYVDGCCWRLQFPFIYRSTVLGRTVEVPAGFETDFNSIPRFFWRLVPPTLYGEAAVLHDWVYRSGCEPRELGDALYHEALTHAGAPPILRFIMWCAVRVFGSRAYRGGTCHV